MNFANYDFAQIKAAADCIAIAREIGLTVSPDGRTAATWRGGTNTTSVVINKDGWHDFSTEQSGSVIDLVALVMFSGMIPQAQNWLGQRLNLTPRSTIRPAVGPTRYDALKDDGFVEVARYRYTDAGGALIQSVIRMEHPERGKEFLQCDATGRWTVKHIEPVLYNLPVISASSWAVVVEGEKDADTLIAWGIPGTTNAGGSKKWQDSFSDSLTGKDIILIPDNDEVGRHHMDIIGKSLSGKAKSIRILMLSQLPKGDVTDWRDHEGGTVDALLDLIRTATLWENPGVDKMTLAAAKEANERPFANFHAEKVQEGNKVKIVKSPRRLEGMIQDCHTRFLNFPRKLGSELFDHDKDTGRIEYLSTPNKVTAWMQLKSKQPVSWTQGEGFATKEEFFEGLIARARRYEGLSTVPDWPRRDDVYYSHPPLPEPDPAHPALEGLLDFFNPAAPEYRILLKALFAAPIFYKRGLPRPLWIIDSEDGAGTGKSTIAEAVAELYGSAPVQTNRKQLSQNLEELIKNLVSNSGRAKRVLLLDNLTGTFHSPELASLVTNTDICGRAPYGHGEETRPNNITYILTANSASVDNDLASRAYYLFVKRGNVSPTWKEGLMDYARVHRMQIFAELLDILNSHRPFDIPIRTRFPEFETRILQPMTSGPDEMNRVLDVMTASREESNSEEEMGQQVEEVLRDRIIQAGVSAPYNSRIFIQSSIVEAWLKSELEGVQAGAVVQTIRNLAKNGLLDIINARTKRYPSHGNQKSGIMWEPKHVRDELSFARSATTMITGNPVKPKLSLV
jgi:5S rRNA maturation endonuclease (ribonuclease M5)